MEVAIGTAVGVAIGLLAGIPLSLFGQRYLAQFLRQRRQLGYAILGAHPIIPKLGLLNPTVRLMVKQSVLDRGYDDPENTDFVDVDELYGFWIRIMNCGNTELVEQPVSFQFSPQAKIILANLEMSPEFGDALPGIHIDNSRARVTVTLPFLNPGDGAIISIQTVYSEDLCCQVVAAGPGLRTFDVVRREDTLVMAYVAGMLAFLAVSGGILLGLGLAGLPSSSVGEWLQILGTAFLSTVVLTMALVLIFARDKLRLLREPLE